MPSKPPPDFVRTYPSRHAPITSGRPIDRARYAATPEGNPAAAKGLILLALAFGLMMTACGSSSSTEPGAIPDTGSSSGGAGGAPPGASASSGSIASTGGAPSSSTSASTASAGGGDSIDMPEISV